MTEQRRPGLAFWLTVALVLLAVAYLASVGPAVWLVEHDLLPDAAMPAVETAYLPLGMLPEFVQDALSWYEDLWR